MKSELQVNLNYDELLLLRLHSPEECKHLNNKLDNAIKDFEEIIRLNNIALMYDMYNN
tara:strand:+ start:284 stop:457 length:174 start_codon:yes stop_codon:yes gene_type:complete